MCMSSTEAPSPGTEEQRETSGKFRQTPITRVTRESSVSAIAVRREQVAKKKALHWCTEPAMEMWWKLQPVVWESR